VESDHVTHVNSRGEMKRKPAPAPILVIDPLKYMVVEVVALNALSMSRWVWQGRPWVVRVGEFSGVEASRRASLIRVGTQSRASRLYTRVAQIDVSI
jgi:hypothetical protein